MKRLAAGILAVLAFALIACGEDGISQDELQAALKDAAQEERIGELEDALDEAEEGKGSKGSPGGGSPRVTKTPIAPAPVAVSREDLSTARDCGGGVLAGPNTTCPFALVVRRDYYSTGSSSFDSVSPVTGQSYRMTCGGFDPVVCAGGNDATVYFP